MPCKFSSYHDIPGEDDSTLEWKLALVDQSVAVDGFVSTGVEIVAIGPQPQDKQLVLVLLSKVRGTLRSQTWTQGNTKSKLQTRVATRRHSETYMDCFSTSLELALG